MNDKKINRKGCVGIWAFILCLLMAGNTLSAQKATLISDINTAQWVNENFAKGKNPPFSFTYGGKKSENFIRNWQFESQQKASAADKEEYLFTYTDKKSGLKVECDLIRFKDFPAVEWVLRFSNTSGKNTPMLENVSVVNESFATTGNSPITLHHSKGSDSKLEDFQPMDEVLEAGTNVYMTPDKGRSSSGTALPFFNIEMTPQEGILVAVGWTGKWYADVVKTQEQTVSLKSGMERMQTRLYPQETIRTPRICMLFWEGENRMAGHNQFRQFILQHHSRKIDGKFAEYPVCAALIFADEYPGMNYECLTEEFALAIVDRYRQFDMAPEVFWLDAGWYEDCECYVPQATWWDKVGTWSPAKDRFPNGFKPISDAMHAIGSKFMVWFEPERVRKDTELHKKYPQWILKAEWYESMLFNLGDEEARLWLTDHISDFIKREGVDYYRQDFNFDPYPFWEQNDQPERIGITEAKYVEGLYAYWDSLLVRFPNLLIDNCAGGGRRIDLETTSRSAPLFRSDYWLENDFNGAQCHTYALNFYLPQHSTSTSITDDYKFHSSLASSVQGAWLVGRGKETIPLSKKYMQKFKDLRPYYYGDYYPLTPADNYMSDKAWLAYQMNRPKEKDGIIVAFRRKNNTEASIRIQLSGLDKEARYELNYDNYGIKNVYKGSELAEGLNIMIKNRPASLLIKYKQIP